MSNTTESISTRAMLARLTIKQWSGRVVDKSVAAEVARNHNVSSDVGRYNKQLVTKTALEAVTKAVSAARTYHAENTLPWLDDGARILPAANFFAYRETMGRLKDDFDRAVESFAAGWPEVIAEARTRLNGLFRDADYPADIESLFGYRVGILPMPDASDFRVDLGDAETARLRDSIESDVRAASQAAVKDCWQRIYDVVARMSERLKAYRINPTTDKVEGIFRDSLVTNIRDLVDLLPRLNFTGDVALAEMTTRIADSLIACDADELRSHDGKRADTIAAADSILAAMGGYLN